MKLTIERSTFLKALGHVQSVVERRNTIPILSNVLLHAKGAALSLTATDLDIEISEQVPADVDADGAITANALTLFEIVKRLPSGAQVRLELSDDQTRLKLSAGRSDFSLAVLPDKDFPTISADEKGERFTMPSDDLRRLIDKTRFAMSQEETRYYLNGIYFHATDEEGGCLRSVATDGHRLARLDTGLPKGAEKIPGVIVPRKAVTELRRLLDDADDLVDVTVSTTKIRFMFNDILFMSKLIDGTFPDYSRVIPSGNNNVMRIDTQDFINAVDRVSTVSADKTRSIKLSLEKDRLKLMVNNPETGSAHEVLSADYKSEPMDIGFNARYLMEIAKEVDGEKLTLELGDSASPAIVRDEEDEHALYVLMPLRV